VPGRKEFDLELTGTFDSKYAEVGTGFVIESFRLKSNLGHVSEPVNHWALHNESLDASGGSVFLNFPGAAVLE
jgi:hypothetical protein